jgi:hypothetical protein
MNKKPNTIPSQKSYYDWNDLTDEVSLHNGNNWLTFSRSSLTGDAAKLHVLRQLLGDDGIDKTQIRMLLESLDSASGSAANPT